MRRPIKAGVVTSSRIKKRRQIARSFFFAFLITLFAGACSFVARAEFFQIKAVTVEGAHDLDTLAISHDVESELAGAYLGLIPKTNRFVYPKAKIEKVLEVKYPRLASSTLHTTFSGTLKVKVGEEPLKFARCAENKAVTASSTDCIFINKSGRSLGPLAGKREGIIILIGTTSPEAALPLAEGLGQTGLGVSEIRQAGHDYVLHTTEGWDLRVASDTSANIDKRVQAAFATPVLKDKAARQNLEYLDLRFGTKLFYKFKDTPEGATI